MRILFWSATFWPKIGGVEVLAAKLLPALEERGYELIVITSQVRSDLPREARYRGIPVYRLPFGWGDIGQLLDIRRQVATLKRTFAPDLIHINAVDISTFFHLTTASASAVPSLVTLHNERLHDRPTEQTIGSDRLLGVALRSADWVTCVSASVLAQVRQMAPEVIAKSSIIYNGLEPPHVLPQPLPTDAPRLLCLGRLITRKGFDLALTAFASIFNRYPHVSLTIAGDGPARAALEQQAAQLGVSGRVEFAGSVAPEEVPTLVNASTIVVMPSRHEPFGLVALDAALMARPIVASRVGGLPEVIEHKQTGLLVDKEDCKGLAEAMAFLLDHPEQARCMGRAARRRALDTFSWESCVSGYANLYRSLIVSAQAKTDWKASKSANGSSGEAT